MKLYSSSHTHTLPPFLYHSFTDSIICYICIHRVGRKKCYKLFFVKTITYREKILFPYFHIYCYICCLYCCQTSNFFIRMTHHFSKFSGSSLQMNILQNKKKKNTIKNILREKNIVLEIKRVKISIF